MRARVYADGFNLYYGALRGTPFKWLNPVRLTGILLPRDWELDRLRYFTARVSGKLDPRAPARQQVYLKALATLPEVEVHDGRFLAKTVWRPLSNLPVAGRQINPPKPVTLPDGDHPVLGGRPQTLPVGVYPSRRGSGREHGPRVSRMPLPDAVIAEFPYHGGEGLGRESGSPLVNDAWQGLFASAVVISNDTDLVLPIRMVTEELKRPVLVVCPGRWQVAPQLRKAATRVRHIRAAMLRAAQFPDTLPGTAIAKPAGW